MIMYIIMNIKLPKEHDYLLHSDTEGFLKCEHTDECHLTRNGQYLKNGGVIFTIVGLLIQSYKNVLHRFITTGR